MAEASAIRSGLPRRVRPAGLMACAAVIDVFALRNLGLCDLGIRAVALEAGAVSVGPCRHRKSDTSVSWRVTRCTIRVRPMNRMTEPSIMRGKPGKRLHFARLVVGMTDGTDRVILLLEMLNVAAGTRNMPCKFDLG